MSLTLCCCACFSIGTTPVTTMALSPDSLSVAVGYTDGQVCVYQIENTFVSASFELENSAPMQCRFLSSNLLATGVSNGSIMVWDVASNTEAGFHSFLDTSAICAVAQAEDEGGIVCVDAKGGVHGCVLHIASGAA